VWEDGGMTVAAKTMWIVLAVLVALFVVGGLMTLLIQPG
jgi:hypothetical protein